MWEPLFLVSLSSALSDNLWYLLWPFPQQSQFDVLRCEISHKDVRNYGPDNRRSGHVSLCCSQHLSNHPLEIEKSDTSLQIPFLQCTLQRISLMSLSEQNPFCSFKNDCHDATGQDWNLLVLQIVTVHKLTPVSRRPPWLLLVRPPSGLNKLKEEPAQCTANGVSSL